MRRQNNDLLFLGGVVFALFLSVYGVFLIHTKVALADDVVEKESEADIGEVIRSLIDPFSSPDGFKKALEEKMAPIIAAEKAKAAEEQARLEEERRISQPELAVSPPVAEPIVLPPLAVSGVIYDTLAPLVIIDGKVYTVGDELDLGKGLGVAKIMSVDKGQVNISYMGANFVLTTESNNKNSSKGSGSNNDAMPPGG